MSSIEGVANELGGGREIKVVTYEAPDVDSLAPDTLHESVLALTGMVTALHDRTDLAQRSSLRASEVVSDDRQIFASVIHGSNHPEMERVRDGVEDVSRVLRDQGTILDIMVGRLVAINELLQGPVAKALRDYESLFAQLTAKAEEGRQAQHEVDQGMRNYISIVTNS